MTPQEESMLNDLIGRVEQTQLAEKDPEAEQLLNQRLSRNPDALYILAQTILVQKYALEQAEAQLRQTRQPAHATSFLGNLLGRRDPAPLEPAARLRSTATWRGLQLPAECRDYRRRRSCRGACV
jgi:uncharacterized protein